MVNLLYTELLKLKRSKMFLISLFGAIVAPFIVVIASIIHLESNESTSPILFTELFYQTNLYTVVVIGVPLYGVVTSYLFTREYLEDTLKNLLTIPVSRTKYIISKLVILLMWIMVLTMVAWGLTLLMGIMGQFKGLSLSLMKESIAHFIIGGCLLFILSGPVILISLVTRNYVPTIIFTIVITLINVMSGNSEHRGLFPWAAAGDIANNTLLPTYPPEYSYMMIVVTASIGFVLTFTFFKKADIH